MDRLESCNTYASKIIVSSFDAPAQFKLNANYIL